MTERDTPDARPFWERKTLEEMTPEEWESLCDGCGRCCLTKITEIETSKNYTTDVGCLLLDTKTAKCTDYPNRLSYDTLCAEVTPEVIRSWEWMPPSCGYRRIDEGKGLEWWHPLVSGDPGTVHQAGISVAGRAIVQAKAGRMEYHTIDWPTWFDSEAPNSRWMRALFSGINASVPTPFGTDSRPELDVMAEHCFWLLSNGCDGLAILDNAGEVASLPIQQRIGVIEGLVSRGVPVSKILLGIGPASVTDSAHIAVVAETLGVRGILIGAQAGNKITPGDVLPSRIKEMTQRTGGNLRLYLSLPPTAAGAAAHITAIESLLLHPDARLTGIRDETDGCAIGFAALERFRDTRLEVYSADDTVLATLVQQGGSGLISLGANLLGRLGRAVVRTEASEATERYQKVIRAATAVLRSGPAVPAIKALLERHTGRPEWGRLRLPLRPLGASQRAALFQSFDACGVSLRPADPAN